MNGFLLIYKEKEITSFGVIKQVKKKLGKIKIGHTGTLDPNTTGLLVLAIGKGCKFIEEITYNSKKVYIAKMQFGIKTTTGDFSGNIIQKKNFNLNTKKVIEAFENFEKTYMQVPPIYSAKKINGKRAYDLARQNIEVDMTKNAKEVSIYKLSIINMDLLKGEISFEAHVSKGTYIRSLIEDIAKELEEVAYMSYLERTQTDGFFLENAHKLEEDLKEFIIPLDEFLNTKYLGKLEIDGKLLQLVKNGMKFQNIDIINKFDENVEDDKLLLKDKEGKIIAIYKKEKTQYVPYIMI